MKKILFAFLIIALVNSFNTAKAQSDQMPKSVGDYKTALGIRLSSSAAMQNNSVSIKQFITETTAIEGLISFGDPLSFGGLVEFHKPLSASGLKYYYGAGGYLAFVKTYNPNKQINETDANFGAQGVVGLDYKFANAPINISLDWKPELNIVTDINFEPAAIGFTARFTFGK